MVEECLYHVGVVLGGGPHQRRLSLPGLAGIRIRAAVQQRVDRGEIAGSGGRHQDRLAFARRTVRIGAGGEQRRDDRRIAVERGE